MHDDLQPARAHRLLDVYRSHLTALSRYQPQALSDGLTLVFSSHLDPQAQRRAVSAWNGLSTTQVEIHSVPGDHYSMFAEPHVRFLAQLLRGCIDAVLAAHRLR